MPKTCPRCHGSGRIPNDDPTGDQRIRIYCPECHGFGKVEASPMTEVRFPCPQCREPIVVRSHVCEVVCPSCRRTLRVSITSHQEEPKRDDDWPIIPAG